MMSNNIPIKYGEVREEQIYDFITQMKNQIFKILPLKEKGKTWDKHLHTIMLELCGAHQLFDGRFNFLRVMCKLEPLFDGISDDDFRKTILETIPMMENIYKEGVKELEENDNS